ncbi:MAG: hypothetical protein ACLSCV_03195 [Acutalibacteraceae bacterium]
MPKLTTKKMSTTPYVIWHCFCERNMLFTGVTTAVVQNLVKRGVAEFYDIEIFRNPYEAIESPKDTQAITLSNQQQGLSSFKTAV